MTCTLFATDSAERAPSAFGASRSGSSRPLCTVGSANAAVASKQNAAKTCGGRARAPANVFFLN